MCAECIACPQLHLPLFQSLLQPAPSSCFFLFQLCTSFWSPLALTPSSASGLQLWLPLWLWHSASVYPVMIPRFTSCLQLLFTPPPPGSGIWLLTLPVVTLGLFPGPCPPWTQLQQVGCRTLAFTTRHDCPQPSQQQLKQPSAKARDPSHCHGPTLS